MRDTNWSYWRTFLAVLNTGSLSSAAKELQTTQPTVGRHIDELERYVEGSLFSRSQKGLLPTPLAVSLQATAEEMSAAARALERRAKTPNGTVSGTVRITASEIVGVEILPPILAQLRTLHPDINIELVLNNQQDDLLSRNADVAVRMTPPEQDRLVRTRIGTAPVGMYGTSSYLATHTAPKTQSQLAQHDLIGFDREEQRLQGFKIGRQDAQKEDFAFRCDSDIGHLAAVRAGLGLGFVQCAIADLESDLIRVLPKTLAVSMSVWLAMHEDLRNEPSVHAVFQHLAASLRHVYNN